MIVTSPFASRPQCQFYEYVLLLWVEEIAAEVGAGDIDQLALVLTVAPKPDFLQMTDQSLLFSWSKNQRLWHNCLPAKVPLQMKADTALSQVNTFATADAALLAVRENVT